MLILYVPSLITKSDDAHLIRNRHAACSLINDNHSRLRPYPSPAISNYWLVLIFILKNYLPIAVPSTSWLWSAGTTPTLCIINSLFYKKWHKNIQVIFNFRWKSTNCIPNQSTLYGMCSSCFYTSMGHTRHTRTRLRDICRDRLIFVMQNSCTWRKAEDESWEFNGDCGWICFSIEQPN